MTKKFSKIPDIIKLLDRTYYQVKKAKKNRTVLDQLVFHIISKGEMPNNANSAFRAFKEEFVDWNEARVSSVRELQEVLEKYITCDVHGKAHCLKEILGQIFNSQNKMCIEFLRNEEFSDVKKYLNELPGLEEDFVIDVLGYSYYNPNLPLSLSFVRVARRIGLVENSISPTKLKRVLERILSPEDFSHFHVLFFLHGENYCTPKSHNCLECPIICFCKRGQEEKRVNASKKTSKEEKISKKHSSKNSS